MTSPARRPVQDATATVRAVLTPEEQRKAEELIQGQWPKVCACGRSYWRGGARVPEWWTDLPFRYQRTDSFSTNEARDCHCGSTLEVMLCVHNPDEAEVSP